MTERDYQELAESHVRRFFTGHEVVVATRALGRADAEFPGLRVLEVQPGPRSSQWVYVSAGFGASHATTGHREFFVIGPRKESWLAQVVAMLGPYHRERGLDFGHTLPLGEPWFPGSGMDHLLMSLPYTFGPELEVLTAGELDVRFMWVLPIHESERRFKVEYGLEALEQRFDDAQLQYADPGRPPVV